MMRRTSKAIGWLLGVWVTLSLAGCSQVAPTPAARVTGMSTAAVTTSPATQVPVEPSGAGAPPASSVPTSAPSSTPWPTPTLVPSPGPLPDLLAKVRLAPSGAQLDDLLLDPSSNRLYVTNTAGQLHILDATTYEQIGTLPAAGALTLDAPRARLYASPLSGAGSVTAVDTVSLAVVGTMSPAGYVSLDTHRDRVYVGNQVWGPPEENAPGVRVYDGATLEKLGEVLQPGIPVYNPLRDELYIVAYTVHVADPEALQVTGDLLPEITAQPLAWCNGCPAATNAHVFPDRNLLVIEVTVLSAGKGPGTAPPPRFFDATTLREISDLADVPPVERGCGGRLILAEPVHGWVYRDETYSRYVAYNNLLVYDLEGALQTWRDGLFLGITNPNTGQMYVPHGADTLVLDLAALSPAGSLPPVCISTVDTEAGRIYGLLGRDLMVFSERGATAAPAPSGRPGSLPQEQILSIQLSPNYAQDDTLFVTTSGKLYRSTDAGQTWTRLRGGLPEGDYLTLILAISPAFAEDRTLFVGGFRGDFWGEGVYRSTDGGDSWQPMWHDLTHLRVYDLALSSEYARDGTLLAYSRYQRLDPWMSGLSLFRSTNQGLDWTLVMTQPQGASSPPPEQFLPAARTQATVQFREGDYGEGVERSRDGGQTWEPLVVTHQPGFYLQEIVTSPTFETDETVYILSEYDLFRSLDGGDTWARWVDGRLEGRDYQNKLATASTSPPLGDERHRLFVGTAAGEFWSLDPEDMAWEPLPAVETWPTVLPGEWVRAMAASPNGDLWVGTWGNGLARVAEGAIQARYTITDGLPSQYIKALAVAPNSDVWAAGDLGPGVSSFDGRTWTLHPFGGEDTVGSVLALAVDPEGVVWAGAQAPGLLRWNGKAWELIPDAEGVTGWWVGDIAIDAEGTLWCATSQGLVFYGGGAWSGQSGGEAYAVELAPTERNVAYLLASGAAVWRFAGGRWTQLPPANEKEYVSPHVLYAAADGAIWLGTPSGAFRYDGRAWRQFTAEDGLPANEVTAITEDAHGRLWFGTDKGAAHVDPATMGLSAVSWPPLPTPVPTPRGAPAAARPTPTPKAQAVPTREVCDLRPADSFAPMLQDGQAARRLGCPTAEAAIIRAAFQPFERGLMVWLADERAILVLSANGVWLRYPDTWDESQPDQDPTLSAPQGLMQPTRGFGKVWREQLGGPEAAMGWALAGEQGYDMLAQPFAGGRILLGMDGRPFMLYADGSWEAQ